MKKDIQKIVYYINNYNSNNSHIRYNKSHVEAFLNFQALNWNKELKSSIIYSLRTTIVFHTIPSRVITAFMWYPIAISAKLDGPCQLVSNYWFTRPRTVFSLSNRKWEIKLRTSIKGLGGFKLSFLKQDTIKIKKFQCKYYLIAKSLLQHFYKTISTEMQT